MQKSVFSNSWNFSHFHPNKCPENLASPYTLYHHFCMQQNDFRYPNRRVQTVLEKLVITNVILLCSPCSTIFFLNLPTNCYLWLMITEEIVCLMKINDLFNNDSCVWQPKKLADSHSFLMSAFPRLVSICLATFMNYEWLFPWYAR